MNIKNRSIKTVLMTLIVVVSGCSDWLTLKPEDSLIKDEFWKTQEQVEAVLSSAYKDLRNTVQNNIWWGDLRGNIFTTGEKASNKEDKLKSFLILPENSICKWNSYYSVIGIANSVIHLSAEAVELDESFSEYEMNEILSEARFLRSLCYFYLVRTFKEVPLITKPYVTDEQSFSVPKTTEEALFTFIESDLTEALKYAKETFDAKDAGNWMNRGRATKYAIHALLADVYMWTGKYQKASESCDAILNSGKYALLEGGRWFDIFATGNTNEGIFEIQYDIAVNQTNFLWDYFFKNPHCNLSEVLLEEMYESNDVRGENSTVNTDLILWKYVGLESGQDAEDRGSENNSDANWIIYRLAEIYLIKAEALAELGEYEQSQTFINAVRERAGASLLELYNPEGDNDKTLFQDAILEERILELTGEGKNWFDILRIARRDNFARKEMLISMILQNVSASDQNIIRSKLSDTWAYYLPVYYKELEVNIELKQNPYYETKTE